MKTLSNTMTITVLKITAILMIVGSFSACHFMPLRHGGGHHYSAGHSVTRSIIVSSPRNVGH